MPSIYRTSAPGLVSCVRQGEMFSNLIQGILNLDSLGGSGPLVVDERTHPYAVVMTQDCDLEQDYRARLGEVATDKQIPAILCCEAITAEALRHSEGINTTIWARIKSNKDERYQFLQKVAPGADALNEGLPEPGLDFKRYFTIPTAELYRRIDLGQAQRRSIIISPYLEHLSTRFATFLSRVALPEEHFSEPPVVQGR
jgi:hypothetical protein